MADISQSVMADLVKAAGGDEQRAASLAKGLGRLEIDPAKVQELQTMFPGLPDDQIVKLLQESGGSVEGALEPGFKLFEEFKERAAQAQQQQQQQQGSRRGSGAWAAGPPRQQFEDAYKEQRTALLKMFGTLSADQVRQAVEAAEGDADAATDALLALVEKQGTEAEAQERRKQEMEQQERRMQQLKIEALQERFEHVTVRQVEIALGETNNDMVEAARKCLQMDRQIKVDRLAMVFKALNPGEIATVLSAHRWVEKDAASALAAKAAAAAKPAAAPTGEPAAKAEPALVSSGKHEAEDEEEVKTLAQQAQVELGKSKAQFDDAVARKKEEFRDELAGIVLNQTHGAGEAPDAGATALNDMVAGILDASKKEMPEKSETNQDEAKRPKVQFTMPLTVSLSVKESRVDVGETVTLQWEASDGATTNWDWVAIFKEGEKNSGAYVGSYQWRSEDAAGGTIELQAPNEYGTYVARYMHYRSFRSYFCVAESAAFSVGPVIKLDATVETVAAASAGSVEEKRVSIRWSKEAGHQPSRPWFGLYHRAQPDNRSYITFEWADKAEGAEGVPVSFDLPVKPGDYQVRFFPGNADKYAAGATSEDFRVDGEDKLDIVGEVTDTAITTKFQIVNVDPKADKAWIGIYRKEEESNRRPRRYKWVGAEREGELTFTSVPIHGGTYVAKLMALNYQVLAVSAEFELPDRA